MKRWGLNYRLLLAKIITVFSAQYRLSPHWFHLVNILQHCASSTRTRMLLVIKWSDTEVRHVEHCETSAAIYKV